MRLKNRISKRVISILLTLTLFVSGIVTFSTEARAAGWLEYANQTITLGTAVSGSIKEGDYQSKLEVSSPYSSYWHMYKVTIPQNGQLNIYMESETEDYFTRRFHGVGYYFTYFTIFSALDPDNYIWNTCSFDIEHEYSSARGRYYSSAEISLDKGEYYFALRSDSTIDEAYYLTLSYKEPTINVNSISLNPFMITMGIGVQQTITATVLPNNATDRTLTWQSANPSIATVDNNGMVTAVSAGTTLITASSSDGEITASCIVTVTCPHDYQTSFALATRNDNGYFIEQCKKCGNIKQNRIIYAISNIALSKKSFSYNGKVQMPSVIVQDSQGKYLTYNTDYTLAFTGDMRNVGKHLVQIKFKGNYKGSASRTFTILPKSTTITKIKTKKKGFSVNWQKQSSQITGYELAYSTSSRFPKSKTNTVAIGRNKTKKTVARLRKGKRYYVRIRTYKNIMANGQTTKLYSNWSKVKSVTTRR